MTRQDLERLARESWIDQPTAERFGLRRVDSIEGADLVGRTDREDYAGLVFPIYWPGDSKPREYHLRRNHPPIENGKPKGKYLAPPGCSNMLLFGPGESVETLTDTTIPIVLVEGLKKLLAAYRLARHDAEAPRFLPCAISGAWNWKGRVGKTTDATGARVDVKGVISDFDRVTWTGRDVIIIFDSDCVTNEKVMAARRGLMAELKKRGARATALDLPALDGLSKTGFDDLLAHRGPEYALALIDTALTTSTSTKQTSGGFAPVSAVDLLDESEIEVQEWIWGDYVAKGSFSALVAKPKAGKSTLIYELIGKVADGKSFLGRATKQGPILILACEEQRRDIRRRLQSLSIAHPEHIHIHVGYLDDTANTYRQLSAYIRQHRIQLVVIDTLNTFWAIQDENNAAQVTAAVKPLLSLARDTEAAVLLIHHTRKSEGDHGDEIRGSGALLSLLDAAFILRRHEAETQRKLVAISRYAETPAELLIELRDHGYEALGDPAAVVKQAKLARLEAALTVSPQTVEDLAKKAGVAVKAAYPLLDRLVQERRADREGEGRRSSPYTFLLVSSSKSGGLEETKSEEVRGGGFVSSDPPTSRRGQGRNEMAFPIVVEPEEVIDLC